MWSKIIKQIKFQPSQETHLEPNVNFSLCFCAISAARFCCLSRVDPIFQDYLVAVPAQAGLCITFYFRNFRRNIL